MLWDYNRLHIKPSTKMGASKVKGDIEKNEMRDFGNDVRKFNSRFEDTRRSIIYEEGEDYNECFRQRFRAYLNCDNEEFKEVVEKGHRKWIQNKLPIDYSFEDLIKIGRVT